MSLIGTLVLSIALLGVAYGEETTNENDSPLYHVRTMQSMEQSVDISLKTIKSGPLEFDEYKEVAEFDRDKQPRFFPTWSGITCVMTCLTTCGGYCQTVFTSDCCPHTLPVFTCISSSCGHTCGCTCSGTCTATCGASCNQSGYMLC